MNSWIMCIYTALQHAHSISLCTKDVLGLHAVNVSVNNKKLREDVI